MGFCLFEEVERPGLYVAVNATQVDSFDNVSSSTTHIVFNDAHIIEVVGPRDEIEALIHKALKIGLQKLQVHILGGKEKIKPAPMLFNHAQRVLYVQEIAPQELPENRSPDVMTASRLFMDDGREQRVTQRPGIFAMRANAKGVVPMLEKKS